MTTSNRICVLALTTCVATMFAADARAQSRDPDIRWFEENGFDSFWFMERCVSVDPQGISYQGGSSLQVGNGWKIECTSYSSVAWSVIQIQASDGTLFCALGELTDLNVDGDQRLSIDIVDAGEHGPAQLEATSWKSLNITPATVFGVANVWPLWLEGHYNTVDIVRDPRDGRTCPQLFTPR